MSLYELPKFEVPKFRIFKNRIFWILILVIFLASFFGFLTGAVSGGYFYSKVRDYLSKINISLSENQNQEKSAGYVPQTTQEEAVIGAVKEASPAVVSIIISKNLPIYEECYINPFGDLFPGFQIPQICQKGTELKEIGGGSGFIISADGLILTNKHVVSDREAEYTVLTNDGNKYSAKVLALDPTQDFAIIQINQARGDLPTVKLGDSDELQIGQSVIAIGNALGEFRNTVSVGVVSGLSRTITASGGGVSETIEDVIQTDAAINPGNSGGPLLNLKGEVIGINTAIVEAAQNISFAIPINKAKKDIQSVKSTGKIVYPFLGVRYVLIDDTLKEKNNLSVNYGAWIQKGEGGDPAVSAGSAAERAGLKEGDIILEFNEEKITTEDTLAKIIMKYNPGDKIGLKVLRNGKEINVEVVLGERSE